MADPKDSEPQTSAEAPGSNGSSTSSASPQNVTAAASTSPKKYVASLAVEGALPAVLDPDFAEAMLALETTLGMPLWFLIQDGADGEHDLCPHIEEIFFKARHELPQGSPVALLIESPGGNAAAAYAIAKMIRKHCGSFTAVIAQWAKSAATLLALGASEIIIAEHAQLGPLDAQLDDYDREAITSALDETQSVERLHAAALEALDSSVLMLTLRSGKRIDTIMPHAMKFTADLMRPLFEKVDVVQYTNRQRMLKVAEEYAIRLLRARHPSPDAEWIAGQLVHGYPEHGFMIDYDEASDLGLAVKEPTAEQATLLDRILLHLKGMNAFGRVLPL